jgi:uncharacterized protein DUF2252
MKKPLTKAGRLERTLLFDLNDFDETLPAPWEWDDKRPCSEVKRWLIKSDFLKSITTVRPFGHFTGT